MRAKHCYEKVSYSVELDLSKYEDFFRASLNITFFTQRTLFLSNGLYIYLISVT